MDIVTSNLTLYYTISKFGNLLTITKEKLRRLQEEIHNNIYILSKMNNFIQLTENQQIKTDLNVIIDILSHDLEEQLTILEMTGRAASIRPFIYFSEYMLTFYKPLQENWKLPRNIIPNLNVVFPENNNTKTIDFMRKQQVSVRLEQFSDVAKNKIMKNKRKKRNKCNTTDWY